MKLGEIYDLFVTEGIKADPRKKIQVQKKLQAKKKEYKKLAASRRRFFDKESLKNPYSDTRILYGDPDREIKRILVGIDIEAGELLLADRLSQEGPKIDLVLAHHPEGVALAGLYDVIDLQTDLMINLGVEEKVARSFLDKRIQQVERGLHSKNHSRAVDIARALDIPLMCCHTPADNHVVKYLQKMMEVKKPKTLSAVVDLLLKESEYKAAMAENAGPKILVGDPRDRAGKIMIDMTGGTEGSSEIFARLSQIGIKTIIGMHLSETHYKKVQTEHLQVVIAGHIASDNLGVNLLLDKLEKRTKFQIQDCSGFRRFRR